MIVEYLKKSDLKMSSSQYEFSNFFNIAYDSDVDLYSYVINKSLYFKTPPNGVVLSDVYTYYTIVSNDNWPLISYKNYNTVDLWWLVCKFNNIVNPFETPRVGELLKILNQNVADVILKGGL